MHLLTRNKKIKHSNMRLNSKNYYEIINSTYYTRGNFIILMNSEPQPRYNNNINH